MEINLLSLTILMLLCGQTFGRTKLSSAKRRNGTTSALAAAAEDGICGSMIEIHEYPCEEHKVTTKDGYILSVQRIPSGKSSRSSGNKSPVLLQHGLFMDGITWLLLPPEKSLAFLLADSNFDVWIANTRGTKYSRGHVSLNADEAAYWDWSWDELVEYELPAVFEYIQKQTGQKLDYVGHSLGTLIALAAFSKKLLLNMLRSASLLCPIAYASQMTSPLARNAADQFLAENLYRLGYYEFDLRSEALVKYLKKLCKIPGVDCSNIMTSFTGQNCCLQSSIIEVFLDHEPQASAMKNMIHLAQNAAICSSPWLPHVPLPLPPIFLGLLTYTFMIRYLSIREGTITMYNYNDDEENKKHYGQTTPPAYNMKNIPNDFPLYLSYGGSDALSDVNDVKTLLNDLKDHEGDKLVVQYKDDYAHADFVMATNAKEDVYDPLLAFLKLQ